MRTKQFLFGADCKSKIFDGIDLMYKCVSATLGAYGRNVLIDRLRQVVDLTKDGVSVAEEVVSSDPWEEMGCKLVKSCSQNTNDEAGDGTTTAIVLARDLCEMSMQLPKQVRVISVKKGMQKAVSACVEEIKKMSKSVKNKKDYFKVASISAQDEDVGETVSQAYVDAGENGAIDIERSDEPGIQVEKTSGLSFEKGWVLPNSVNQPDGTVVQEEIHILVTDAPIRSQHMIVPIMQECLEKTQSAKMVVIADDYKGDTLGMMASNLNKKSFHIIPIRAPGYGKNKIEVLKDICAATGATFISEENAGMKLEKVTLEHLGKCRKITCEREKTIITAMEGEDTKQRVFERICDIESQLKEEKDDMKKADLKTRLATLTDGITILYVGGQTEQERRELKHRVEDAVRACESASEEGVVCGGGVALLKCIPALERLKMACANEDEKLGIDMIRRVLSRPALKVLEVAGIEDKEYLVEQMKQAGGNLGYDFNKGELADIFELGVWDAAKVTRSSLQNASACAQSFLTLDVAILTVDQHKQIMEDFGEAIGVKN